MSYRDDFTGKIALVTGASSGIGRAAAREFARRGATVVASARREAELKTLVDEITGDGGSGEYVVADINVEAEIQRLIDGIVDRHGHLDIAFNNAGTEGKFTPFLDQDNETFDRVFGANVRGPFWCMRHELRHMLPRGKGVIVNDASIGSIVGFENAAIYTASKHALIGMTKTVAIEAFKQGVRVNAICPGLVETAIQDRIWTSEQKKAAFVASSVPGRMGSAEEMARAVCFLASDDASYISGHALLADGGYTIA